MSNGEFGNLTDEDSDFDPDNEYNDCWPRNERNEDEEEDNDNDGVEEPSNDSATVSSNIFNKLTRTCIREILEIVEQSEDVSYKNTLEINLEMQSRLQMIRQQIEVLYHKVKKRYSQNEQRLLESLKTRKTRNVGNVFGKLSRGERFYIKGNTYFKDRNDRFCPNNEDYFQRRKNGEIFPMDFDLVSRHIWSIADKMSVVKGIKEQILCEKSQDWLKNHGKLKLAKMLEEVGDDFRVDWTQISAYYLRHRHSATSCKAMWEVYLQPTIKHSAFTQAEKELLMSAALRHKLQDWASIAAEVGQRSDYQCFLQYHTSPYFRNRPDRWDKKDDLRLLDLIEKSRCNGVVNWNQVAFFFPKKSKNCLQQRYLYAINPSISHEPFSSDEDLLLFAAVQEYGTNFAKFPTMLFPNRSSTQLRSRYWNTLQDRHKKSMWTLEDDELLMSFVKEHGKSSWKKCADLYENRHNRISCRQRYTVIQRHLQKDANATLEQLPRREPRMNNSSVTRQNWQGLVEMLRTNPNATLEFATPSLKRKRRRPPVRKQKLDSPEVPKEGADQTIAQPPAKVRKKYNKKRTISKAKSKEISEAAEVPTNEIVPSTSKYVPKPQEESKSDIILSMSAEIAKLHQTSTSPAALSTPTSADSVTLVYESENLRYSADDVAKFIYHPHYKDSQIPTARKVCVVKREEKKKIKNFIYLDHLRGYGMRFHNLFKFSYDFWFCREIRNTTSTASFYVRDAKIVKHCLGLVVPQLPRPLQAYYNTRINGLYMSQRRRQILANFARQGIKHGTALEPDGNLIQPNFSTLVAFRAMCALMGDIANRKLSEKCNELENNRNFIKNGEVSRKCASPTEEMLDLPVMERFRQRFRAIFYQTAVLSRLPPSTFDNPQIKEPQEYCPETVRTAENVECQSNDDVVSSISECSSVTVDEVVKVKTEPESVETDLLLKCKEEPNFGEEFY